MGSQDLILSSDNLKSDAEILPGSAVQTFLPYPGFAASARALDDRRLGKQRPTKCHQTTLLKWPKIGQWQTKYNKNKN
jgi:hypothetical protein